MKELNFIPADYVEPGFIAAVPNVHSDFRFSYRPSLVSEQSKVTAMSNRVPNDVYDRRCAELVADHLEDWDLVDQYGQPVAITAENALRLKPLLFGRLLTVVLGTGASDTDPTWASETTRQQTKRQVTAALSGQNVGQVLEEGAVKNSDQG